MSGYRWEEYQSFFQLIILRYLVVWFSIVPIIASLISQLPNPLPINIMGVPHEIDLTLPFYWQLLWLSSLFFVIALGLYKFYCPKFIHKYNNFSDYCAYKHHPRWLTWEAHRLLLIADKNQRLKFIERLNTKNYLRTIKNDVGTDTIECPIVGEQQTTINFRISDTLYQFGMPIISDTPNDSEKDIFYELFGRYSESRPIVRFLIKALLAVSLALFLAVLCQHIYNGSVFIYKWIFGFFNQ